jgi:hypothetical protein
MTHNPRTTLATRSETPADNGLRRFAVTFTSIDVTKIVDPGTNAEVDFSFTVNAKTQHYLNNDLRIGETDLPSNLKLRADVAPTASLSIDVSGVEKDPTSADDPLPAFSRVFTHADSFGVGEHTGGGANAHLAYTIAFEIAEEAIPPQPPPAEGGGDGKGDEGTDQRP